MDRLTEALSVVSEAYAAEDETPLYAELLLWSFYDELTYEGYNHTEIKELVAAANQEYKITERELGVIPCADRITIQ